LRDGEQIASPFIVIVSLLISSLEKMAICPVSGGSQIQNAATGGA
jgi:hypothetical protein